MRHERDADQAAPKWQAYAVTAGIGLVVTVLVMFQRGFALTLPAYAIAGTVSDGAFFTACVIGGVGVLMWVATTGFFDMLSYGMQGLWYRLTPFMHSKGQGTFYDYKQERIAKRKIGRNFVWHVGLGFLVLASIALALYYALGGT